MRLPVDRLFRLGLIAAAAAVLGGCSLVPGADRGLAGLAPAPSALAAQAAGTGPAADYPVVVGEPYRIGDSVFTPVDTFNFDEVGFAVADSGMGVTGAHHTLPVPSYAEVTSLDNGRTILVRLERRGPMTSEALVGLSPAAMAQLGATATTPVRLRRVNPPEDERALLRAGQSAPLRMDTPESLLAVLKRKLPASGSAQLARAPAPAPIAGVEVEPSSAARELPVAASPVTAAAVRPSLPAPPLPPLAQRASVPAPVNRAVVVAALPQQQQQPAVQPVPRQAASPQPVVQPVAAPTAARAAPASNGAFVVQVAALSSRDRAQQVASAIGGQVSQAGSLYRIRTGPFTTRGQAEASLAKVRAAGYSEARIFTNG